MSTTFDPAPIKEFFLEKFEPAKSYESADLSVSTNELFASLYNVFPFKDFTAESLHSWLKEANFKLIETGKLTFEWILMKKQL